MITREKERREGVKFRSNNAKIKAPS